MKNKLSVFRCIGYVLFISLLSAAAGFAQQTDETSQISILKNLSKRVSVTAKQEKLSSVLDKISRSGNFYFSYSGTLFKPDSLVSIRAKNAPVREVLDELFNGRVDYKEKDDYIILRYAVLHFTIEPENIEYTDKQYVITGHVTDTETGKRIHEASVYEKRLLQATLTDQDGYFRLRFKGDHPQVILTASKELYRDTSLIFLADLKIRPEGYEGEYGNPGVMISNMIEESGIGRFLTSSAQRIQSINIPNFLANSPFQASILPGLSSHGIMSSQVVNKASLNVLGGYTAGVDGIELAGLFNLNKGDVKPVQVAGLLNVVGGSVEGVQVAGLANSVFQDTKGVQVAGLFNHVRRNVNAIQVGGIGNISSRNMKGLQLGGIGNIASRKMNGIQVSGVFNYAKNMQGFQLGLINAADSSSGVSLGLLNLVKHGYHKISFSTNDVMNANAAFKSGNKNLYTILLGGYNFSDTAKVSSFGLGLGHDLILSRTFSFGAELSTQYLYLGNWDYTNLLHKGTLNLQIKIAKGLSVFGGPNYSVYRSKAPLGSSASGYKSQIAPDNYKELGDNTKAWVGWNVGITLF